MVTTTNHNASDVYTTEQDLSQVIRNNATTVGAIVGATAQGPLGPNAVTGSDGLALYGPSNPAISFVQLCARDFLSVASTLYINRVAGAGYAYAGTLLRNTGTPTVPVLGFVGYGATGGPDPHLTVPMDTAGGASTNQVNLAYIYGIGPGAFYNNYAVDIQSNNLSAPATPTATPASSGGTLATGTYNYQVTAIGKAGETLPSTVINATIASGSTNSVALTWTAVPGALGYRIYGRATGAVGLLGSSSSSVTTFVDTGSITPGAAPPASAPASDPEFTIRVFDKTQSVGTPVETWTVTLAPNTDGFGNQTEIEDLINNNSNYIRVVSNYDALTAVPPIFSLAAGTFSGGNDGAAVQDSDIVSGYSAFSNKDSIKVNVLINAGYSTVAVQQAMISLATSRGDCVCILDTPSTQQAVQNALSYRLLTLNANTSRACLITPDSQEIDTDTNKKTWVPPSGAVAARLAYTDMVQNPGWSAAGLNRGIIPNSIQLRYNYDEGMRDLLAGSQVCYLRSRLGVGTYLQEQLTLQSKFSAESFLSVRRILDVLENSISDALDYSLQENNTAFVITQINSMLTQYLDSLKASETIQNYNIVIDNTAATRGQGQLGIKVFITPTLPINQILLTAIITQQGVTFTEGV